MVKEIILENIDGKAVDRAVFSEAVKLTEMELSGDPNQKYEKGSIQHFNKQATKDGTYKSYIDQVIKRTEENLPKLAAEVENTAKATFTPKEKLIEEARARLGALYEEDEE